MMVGVVGDGEIDEEDVAFSHAHANQTNNSKLLTIT